MGKKKKGGNKLARMSEEERARYLQHRADMEEEARRRKETLIALYMKNKLKREDAFTRLNMAKINQEWRSILRQLKCEELKEEIKCVEVFCGDSIEHKNQVIRRLLCDLDESEELYATMLHAHVENIERIITLHSERLKFWHEWYVTEKQSMLGRFHGQMTRYRVRKDAAQEDLECICFALETEIGADEQSAAEEHTKRTDDLRNTMTIRLEEVTKDCEQAMETLWSDFQQVLNNYLSYTQDFHDEYLDLKRRDEEDTKLIQAHYFEVARNTEIIAELRFQLAAAREERDFTVSQLERFRGKLQQRYENSKGALVMGAKEDKERIRRLVVSSSSAIRKLEGSVKKGNVLLQLVGICSKLETEREKVVPFNNEPVKKWPESKEAPEDDFKNATFKLFSRMENFWIRFNRARLDCAYLQEERVTLQQSNRALRHQLREYLVAVTMKSTRCGDAHLLERRPRSMKVEKVVHIELPRRKVHPKLRRPVTCIEGNLSVAVRSQQLAQSKFRAAQIFPMVNGS
ncbi:dynein regulatory complex subunit 2 [Phlebotomus argentipes]|uniref:dynein regulatory complex subunit 2 n=1 Tax=Phlebotomus argentipes TaxID=94469 RepID=UPI0028935C3F|nr:dynein regulatory complex subunit 2 [Phlebotomus argentipes]